jgi:hypothetical protein
MVREEEDQELQKLRHGACPLEIRRGSEDKIGKISILIQVCLLENKLVWFFLGGDLTQWIPFYF